MNGGGILVRRKDFLGTAALVDALVRDKKLRTSIVAGERRALEAYRTENVARILMDHIDRVSRP
jgi:hypothetical protein